MKATRLASAFVLLGVLGSTTCQVVTAAEEEYIPKAKVTPLVSKPLAGVDGKDVLISHFELPANFVGERHYHPGPVFVYVLEGELTVDADDVGRQTFKPGEVYEEPIHRVMQARNMSTTTPTKIVVFQVGDLGKPMMIKAK